MEQLYFENHKHFILIQSVSRTWDFLRIGRKNVLRILPSLLPLENNHRHLSVSSVTSTEPTASQIS